jgi:cytoskeletal protein RodZ
MIAVIRSQHRQSAEKRRQFMNRHHVATATILLIIAAGTLASYKGHSRQRDIQFAEMQTSRGESNGTARPSPRHSSYSSNESEQATEDSQALAGSDTDGPDSEGQDMDGQGTSSSARLDLTSWRPQTAGDSSATVTLPPHWRLTAVADGSASVAGPNGQQMVLGFQTLITPGSSTYAPYMGPVQALNWITRIQGIQLLRVLDREPASERNPSGEAEFLTVVTRQPDGATYKGLALVTTTQMQEGTWMLHVSCIAAPVDQFDAAAPTMMAIWNSWKLDDGYVNDGQHRAAEIQAQTREMAMRDAARAGHAQDNQTTDFINTINGVNIDQDDTGQRYEVQFGAEQRFQRDCVSKGRNCHQVPTNELGPPQ